MLQAIKRVVFWTYERGSWQYDILCIVILCFIFLTPKAVFDGSAFPDNEGNKIPPGQQEERIEEKQASTGLSTDGSEDDSEEDGSVPDSR
jgi:hypothetical protein